MSGLSVWGGRGIISGQSYQYNGWVHEIRMPDQLMLMRFKFVLAARRCTGTLPCAFRVTKQW